MSYILDALRRSQAERERGRVPGLDAQPVTGSSASATRSGGPTLWLGLGAGLALGLTAALAAWMHGRDPGAAPAPAPTTAVTSLPATAPGSVAATPGVVRSNPTPAPFPIVVSAPPPAPPPAIRAAGATALASAASAAESAPTPVAQLPPAQRRELPPLAVGGVIWSESAASRFVILDGQVVREGANLGPGLSLLRIERNAAILNWRGRQLRLPL